MSRALALRAGGQVRQQFAAGVVGGDLDRVSDDVLRHRGVQSNFVDSAAEHFVRESVHSEADAVTF